MGSMDLMGCFYRQGKYCYALQHVSMFCINSVMCQSTFELLKASVNWLIIYKWLLILWKPATSCTHLSVSEQKCSSWRRDAGLQTNHIKIRPTQIHVVHSGREWWIRCWSSSIISVSRIKKHSTVVFTVLYEVGLCDSL